MAHEYVTKDLCEANTRLLQSELKNITSIIQSAVDDLKDKNQNSRDNGIINWIYKIFNPNTLNISI